MTATPSTARGSRARDRWTRLVDALGAKVVQEGRAEMACPVHEGAKPSKFAISVGDTSDYPLLRCRSECDSDDPAWLAKANAALLALGAPADCLPPTKGQSTRSARSTASTRTSRAKPAARKGASPRLPDEEQVQLWQDNLLRERMILRSLCSKWQVTEDDVLMADVGWDPVESRVTFPVCDVDTGDVVQVLYRDISDNRPVSRAKVKTQTGVTGSYIYAPFGIAAGKPVILCAGEHDVFSAHASGFNAVCFTNGEGSVPIPERLTLLAGRRVVIAYDNDPAGRSGANRTAAAVASVARSVAVADVSKVADLPEKGDVADVLRMHGPEKLKEVIAAAEPWEGEAGEGTDAAEGPQPVDWQEFWATDPEPIRYHVDALIAKGEITRLYAQAKVGKSLIIQEAAAALAMGGKVLGHPCEPTDVLYIDQENTWEDWKTRLADMGYGPDDDWSRLHWYSLQSWPALDSAEGGALILAKVQAHGASLVVIDTQSKVLDGEEDKAPTSAAFYRHTLLPLKRSGVAVVIIDHAGNDPAKPRGSSGKRDDVDVVWQVMPRTKDKLTLKRTHSRKRHEQDVLYVNRLLAPLRHELSTEDERSEEMIDACTDTILALDPRPDLSASQNAVIKALRERAKAKGHKGFRDATVREAWRRISGQDDGEMP